MWLITRKEGDKYKTRLDDDLLRQIINEQLIKLTLTDFFVNELKKYIKSKLSFLKIDVESPVFNLVEKLIILFFVLLLSNYKV